MPHLWLPADPVDAGPTAEVSWSLISRAPELLRRRLDGLVLGWIESEWPLPLVHTPLNTRR